MNLNKIVKDVVRRSLVNESRKRKDTLDEVSDGKRLYDMMVDIHDVIKDLAKPIYGVRQQKENLDRFDKFYTKNQSYFNKIAKKFNKVKEQEGSGPFDIMDIIRIMYNYCAYIIRTSNNPNNQLDGVEEYLKHFPDEVKEFDSNMKQEIEEYAKGQGRNSTNFFKGLIYDKDLDLIDIMSNIDFILELQNKYNLRLLTLPMGW